MAVRTEKYPFREEVCIKNVISFRNIFPRGIRHRAYGIGYMV